MIKTIEIENFQSHRRSSFNFSPGVNIIKGTSHNGKTAVVRAIRWALSNRPSTTVIRNWFAEKNEDVKVAIEFDDGFIIRKSGKDFNGYLLPDVDYDAIGPTVPDEVNALSRLTEINLQGQFDKYYMIQEGPQSAAQKLNEIVGLQIIDEVMSRAVKGVQTIKDWIRSYEDSTSKMREALEIYSHLDSVEVLIKRIETSLNTVEKHKKRRTRLSTLKDEIVQLQQRNRSLGQFLTVESRYDLLLDLANQRSTIARKRMRLEKLWREMDLYSEQLSTINENLLIENEVNQLTSLQKRITEMQNKRLSLEKLHRSIVSMRKRKIEHTAEIRDAEKHYQETLNEAGICPTCGQKIEEGCCGSN